jgi:hypothetical protein
VDRRKAIFAMMCAAAGTPVYAQAAQQTITNDTGIVAIIPTDPAWIELELSSIGGLRFEWKGKALEYTPQEVWDILNG